MVLDFAFFSKEEVIIYDYIWLQLLFKLETWIAYATRSITPAIKALFKIKKINKTPIVECCILTASSYFFYIYGTTNGHFCCTFLFLQQFSVSYIRQLHFNNFFSPKTLFLFSFFSSSHHFFFTLYPYYNFMKFKLKKANKNK